VSSYRVSRRAFLASLGGAVGLEILLQNLEAAAEGAGSPPRFLMCHFPDGTARRSFVPSGGRSDFQFSRILKPFETAGLRDDLIILYGLAHRNRGPSAGGCEGGTVFSTTGADSPGTRKNGGEGDDSVAGGPSFDQIFLKNVPALRRPGVGYVNAICDARVDSLETSTQCLSYGYEQRSVQTWSPLATDGTVLENVPLMPALSPVDVYASLFSSFVPGTHMEIAAVRALRLRKSVLDSTLRELARLSELAPASQREKIEMHAAAVRKAEQSLQDQLSAVATGPSSCVIPVRPDPSLRAQVGSRNYYGNEKTSAGDEQMLEAIGKSHLMLIRTAFQCDLLRVATFQWCPGTNQVAFSGMYPLDPQGAYRFHPMTQRLGDGGFWAGPVQTGTTPDASLYQYVCNVMTWFNLKLAEALLEFKTAKDAFGNSLLDYTVIPVVTDIADPSNARTPLPALILGGRKLGMRGGQFVDLSATPVSHNALWLSVAQAYFPDLSPTEALKAEVFMQSTNTATAPIEGLWAKPS
jgi:hypothetical protein